MTSQWTLAAAAVAAGCAMVEAAPFTVVRDGEPVATIVLGANPSRAAEFAAQELQAHVRLITGAELPIAFEADRVAGARILVGESAATRKLGLRGDGFASQEYLVGFRGDDLVLIGRDAPTVPVSAKWVDAPLGKCLEFDGKDDVLVFPEPGFSDEAGTLEAWVWLPAEPPKVHGTILRLDGANPWTYHIVQRDAGTNVISYTVYDGAQGAGAVSKPLAEGWHHIAATHSRDTGLIELLVDGMSQGTAPLGVTTCATAPLHIGGYQSATVGNAFAGRIDEVRVSTTVRTEGALMSGPLPRHEDTALLLHFDEGEGRPRDSSGHGRTMDALPEPFEEKGTLSATYDFLERYCGVRWYVPGELGTAYPSERTLTVERKDLRRSPAMIHRWITPTALFVPTPQEPVPANEVALWKLRMRIGGQPFWVCHSFEGYYDRFLKDHPDWFAQGYEGRPPQMCFTSPGFIAQVVQDAKDYFDGKGAQPGAAAMGDVFGLVPMDNMSWCKCPNCQAELNEREKDNPQFSNGKASDYIWNFVNKVAREVGRTHPDKWIGALAYSDYAYYPTHVALEPNVLVQMCLHTRNWWVPSMERNDTRILNQWVERGGGRRPLYLWLYYCFPALNAKYENYNGFPSYFAHTAVRQMRMYREAGIRGIFIEHSSEFDQTHLMDVPDLYVTLRLADDPSLDGDRLIREFFTRFYGAAGGPMRELYGAIERAYSSPSSYPEEVRTTPAHTHQNEKLAWGSAGNPERMEAFGRLMERAKAAARTEVERRRVALFERGMWEYMVAGAKQYQEKIAGGE